MGYSAVCQAGPASTRSHSGAGGRSGLRVGLRRLFRGKILVTAAFRYYYYIIIIFSNYGPNHKGRKAQRTRKEIRGGLRLDDPCGSWAGLARISLLAVARGPGWWRYRLGWLAWRGIGGQWAGRAKTTGSREDAKFRLKMDNYGLQRHPPGCARQHACSGEARAEDCVSWGRWAR